MSIGTDAIIWARGKMGKKVGRGECWDLVNSALVASKGKGSEAYGTIGPDIDYIWGDEVDLTDVQAGDIVQTRDHMTTWTFDTTITYADGSTDGSTDHQYLPREHHSAIVTGLPDRDGALPTIEQNIDPKGKVVQVHKLYTRDVPAVKSKKAGSVPDPKDPKKKVKATIEVETTIEVTGTIWVYRPQKA